MHSTTWARRLRAVLLLPLLVVLAACGSFKGSLEVQDVDTLYVNFELGIEKDIASMSGISSAQALCDEFSSEDGGVTGPDKADPSETDDMYVCTVAGTIARENFNGDFQLSEDNGEYHLVVTPADAGLEGADAFGDIDFQLTVEFPGDVIESSGGTVDGKTVTYTDLNEFASTGIDIRAKTGGSGLVWAIVGGIALLVVLVIIVAVVVAVVLLLRRRKRAGSTVPPVPGGYAGPSGTASASPAPNAYGGPGSAAPGPNGQGPSAPGQGVPPAYVPPSGGTSPAPQGYGSPQGQGYGSPVDASAPQGYGSPAPSAPAYGSPSYGSPTPPPAGQPPLPGPGGQPPASSSSWASPGPQAPVQPPHHGSPAPFPGQSASGPQGSGAPAAPSGQEASQNAAEDQPWAQPPAPHEPSGEQPPASGQQPWSRPDERG